MAALRFNGKYFAETTRKHAHRTTTSTISDDNLPELHPDFSYEPGLITSATVYGEPRESGHP